MDEEMAGVNDDAFFLEADDGGDTDSALGDDISLLSSTASLRSSLTRQCDENGRKYHGFKAGKYLLPTDDEEMRRQEFQYHLCLATFGAYSFAPFTRLHRVLDVGCGRGLWAIDFAEAHPEAEVIGVDLSPVQEQYVPPNVQFEIDDLEEPWTFSFKYDYIHLMMMIGAFRDWPAFYRQCFQSLNSGGWVEIQDLDFPIKCGDGSLPADSVLQQWNDLMIEASVRSGCSLDTCGRAVELMRDAGFVDIVRIPFKWPMGPWPKCGNLKQLGAWVVENFHGGAEAFCLALFTRYLGWNLQQVRAFVAELRNDFRNRNFHTYFDLYVVYGRKP